MIDGQPAAAEPPVRRVRGLAAALEVFVVVEPVDDRRVVVAGFVAAEASVTRGLLREPGGRPRRRPVPVDPAVGVDAAAAEDVAGVEVDALAGFAAVERVEVRRVVPVVLRVPVARVARRVVEGVDTEAAAGAAAAAAAAGLVVCVVRVVRVVRVAAAPLAVVVRRRVVAGFAAAVVDRLRVAAGFAAAFASADAAAVPVAVARRRVVAGFATDAAVVERRRVVAGFLADATVPVAALRPEPGGRPRRRGASAGVPMVVTEGAGAAAADAGRAALSRVDTARCSATAASSWR